VDKDYGRPQARPPGEVVAFEIYKKDQGKYTRWGTVAGIALLVGIGMYWLGTQVLAPLGDWHVGSVTIPRLFLVSFWVLVFGIAGVLMGLWAVNRPRSAEFLIMTESEMRKVNWSTRKEVVISTKVVIFLTLAFACMLALVDYGFVALFQAVGLLPPGQS
jgi:preprotein translocase subunit SecE